MFADNQFLLHILTLCDTKCYRNKLNYLLPSCCHTCILIKQNLELFLKAFFCCLQHIGKLEKNVIKRTILWVFIFLGFSKSKYLFYFFFHFPIVDESCNFVSVLLFVVSQMTNMWRSIEFYSLKR